MDIEIKRKFKKSTGFEIFDRQTNCLSDNIERKDRLFEDLARKFFDDPAAICDLENETKKWISQYPDSETLSALAGYICYLKEDFERSCDHFLKSINLNPDNFDNWHDLAFALRHLGEAETSTAILYYYDYVIHYFKILQLGGKDHATLKKAILEIRKKAILKDKQKNYGNLHLGQM